MKNLAAVLVLCLVSVNAYLPVGPPAVDNVHSRVGAKVVGGTAAKSTPWQISLVSSGWFGDSHICGGTLIGPKTVLTAAHCCDGSSASTLKVKYDGLDRTKLGTTNTVTQVIMSPDYNSNTIDSDFCILRLQNAVVPSSTVQIVEIISPSPPTGTPCSLTGWGKTSGSTNSLPTQLQYAEFTILSATDCTPKWSDVNPITDTMICAQAKTASGCNGDSGGPLMCGGKLCGVVSWGANGCPPDTTVRPTVYGDPASPKAKKFIDSNLQ